MKSFTKLAVLLLTLALLCTSVFAVTIFAGNEEVATVSTSSEVREVRVDANTTKGIATPAGTIGFNATTSATTRYGVGSYRDLYVYGQTYNDTVFKDAVFKIVSRTPENETLATSMGECQAQMNRYLSGKTISDYGYIVYDFVLGTENKFFENSGSGTTFLRLGGQRGQNGFTFTLANGSDGKAYLYCGNNKAGCLGTITESGVEANLTFVAKPNADTSIMYVFVNGVLTYECTLGSTSNTKFLAEANIGACFGLNGANNAYTNMSAYIDSVSISYVNGSSADVQGDLAYLISSGDTAKYAVGSKYTPLDNWVNGTTTPATAETVVADTNTFGVQVAIGTGKPLYAELTTEEAQSVLNKATDVTLTLLEDLTLTNKDAPASYSGDAMSVGDTYNSQQPGGYNAFNTISSGTKILNLNGHTFSHLPLSYGPLYDKSLGADAPENAALPGRGQTFTLGNTATLVINGANAEGKHGKIVKVSSANALFRHSGGAPTVKVSDVDFEITTGVFYQRGTGVTGDFTAEFTDITYVSYKTQPYYTLTDEKTVKSINETYTNWDCYSYTADLSSLTGSASGKTILTFRELSDHSFNTYSYSDVTIEDCENITLGVSGKTIANSNYTVKNSTVDLTAFGINNSGIEAGTVTFENCTINASSSAYNHTSLVINGCTVNKTAAGSFTLNNYSTATVTNSTFNIDTTCFKANKDIREDGTDVTDTNAADKSSSTLYFEGCKFANPNGAANYHVVGTYQKSTTYGAGCMATANQLSAFANKIADGCYIAPIAEGEEGYADGYSWIVKEFDFNALGAFANLTLYTDINYNLYIPVESASDYISAINGQALESLTTVKDKAGVDYYWLTFERAAHNANEEIDFEVTLSSALLANQKNAVYGEFKKTLSVADYIERVYATEELESSYALMSDLVDYVVAATNRFNPEADLTAFDDLNDYATQNNTVPASETKQDSLGEYISGSTLNLEASNVKFKFNVAKAGEFTYSYVSADGTEVTNTATYEAGGVIEVSMRAYDLNAVITISVDDLSDDYDLAAYANGVKDSDAQAYALVVEMYNYAVSARLTKIALQQQITKEGSVQ